ncbi:MAG: hypothetical protein ACXWJX_08860 [Limisphaerales bacterium]
MSEIITLYISDLAKCELAPEAIIDGVRRHARNEWGVADPRLNQRNHDAIQDSGRVVSVFASSNGTRYKVISKGDRHTAYMVLDSEGEAEPLSDATKLRLRAQRRLNCV